jgi:hypothetical protein
MNHCDTSLWAAFDNMVRTRPSTDTGLGRAQNGGRKPGALARDTKYIVKLMNQDPEARPAEIVERIFQLAEEDDDSPYVVDKADEVLIECDSSKTITREDLAIKVSKAKFLYLKKAQKRNEKIFQKS